VLGGEVVGAVDGVVAVGAQDGAVLHAEHEAEEEEQTRRWTDAACRLRALL
jgi:hypothetical protein